MGIKGRWISVVGVECLHVYSAEHTRYRRHSGTPTSGDGSDVQKRFIRIHEKDYASGEDRSHLIPTKIGRSRHPQVAVLTRPDDAGCIWRREPRSSSTWPEPHERRLCSTMAAPAEPSRRGAAAAHQTADGTQRGPRDL